MRRKHGRQSLYPGQEPLYNTVDTSLGYIHIHASYEYLKHAGGEDDYRFIREEVYPKLKEIVADSPQRNRIFDRDGQAGLLHAGLIHAPAGWIRSPGWTYA